MADRLHYDVPVAPHPGAREAWDEFIETLHTSGTLRMLTGLCGRFAEVSDVALSEAQSPAGRHLLGSFALLGECLTRLPARKLSHVTEGLDRGLDRAAEVLREDPPSTFHLLRMARDPDARRALAAALEILSAVGHALSESAGDDNSCEPHASGARKNGR